MYVYDNIDASNNFAFRTYVKIRVYVQIRAIYITYTHILALLKNSTEAGNLLIHTIYITYTYNIRHRYVHIKHDIHQ